MLKIRRFKPADQTQIAEIMKKVPFASRMPSSAGGSGLRWSVNVSDPARRPSMRAEKRANFISASPRQQKLMKKNLVVVDNGEIVGFI